MGIAFVFSDGSTYTITRPPFIPRGTLGRVLFAQRLIQVSKNLSGLDELDTFVHEYLHVEFPEFPEKLIGALASIVSAPIWSAGARIGGNGDEESLEDSVAAGLCAGGRLLDLLHTKERKVEHLCECLSGLPAFLSLVGYSIGGADERKAGFKREEAR